MAADLDADKETGVSNAFRAGLRRELPRWRADGLIDAATEQQLTARYRLDQKSADVTAAAIYLLGALLIGGGVISFVAWNWDRIPDALKIALGAALMLGADLLGFWWWKVARTRPRLGHAVVFLGTLLYGANIGLLAQIFHISSNWYGGFGAWALGAVVAAWALPSLPHAALGAVLAFTWSCGFVHDHPAWSPLGPALLAVLFVPLAVWRRSRLVFALVAFLTVVALGVGAGTEAAHGTAPMAAMLAGCAVLLAWPLGCRPGSAAGSMTDVAHRLGVLGFGLMAFVASFHDLAREFSFDRLDAGEWHWWLPTAAALLLAAVFVVAGFQRTAERGALVREHLVNLTALASVLVLYLGLAGDRNSAQLAIAANAALLATAGVAVAQSIQQLERGPFWLGTLTLAGVIVARFFEIEANLGVKAAVFVASGVAVILVGLAFERRLRAQGGKHGAA